MSSAAPKGTGAPVGISVEDGRLVAGIPGGTLRIEAVAPSIVRVAVGPRGRRRPRRSWAVLPELRALRRPEARPSVQGGVGTLETGALRAQLGPDGRLSIGRMDGSSLVEAASPTRDAGPDRVAWTQAMPIDRSYFGLGERTGSLEKRGDRATFWTTDVWAGQGPRTDSLHVAIPFLFVLEADGRASGLYLDSTFRSAFDLRDLEHRRMAMQVEDGELTWYCIDGPTPAQVLERFTGLVGRATLPPRWVFGYHQARWSYGSADEVRRIARSFRDHAIPCDTITLDIEHLDGYRVFTWDPERFPDPAGLIAELASLGFRTSVLVDAGVKRERGYGVYDEGHARGFFLRRTRAPDADELTGEVWPGTCVFPDHTRAEVRRWWGQLHRDDLDRGVAGFVDDMNEPAMRDRPMRDPATRDVEPPPETPFGGPDEPTTHAEVRNLYGLLMCRATAEGMAVARPGRRPFVLTRSGFTGIQRHAVVFTGDNDSAWEHLELSLPQLLGLGLSGVPFAGVDIGGFFGACPDELLVRWTQLGAFYPFARNNSAEGTPRQEPWSRGEPTLSRCRSAIAWRYRLLPYLYGVAREAATTGLPFLRPLFLHHGDDPATHRVADQAFVGRDLLVAPVLHPGKAARDVYLPAGRWCDVRSGGWAEGGVVVLAEAPLGGDLPLFARAGSVVPTAPVLQWSDERTSHPVTLHAFPDRGGTSRGVLFEDDGESVPAPDDASSLTRITVHAHGEQVVLHLDRTGGYRPAGSLTLEVHQDGRTARVDVPDRAWWHGPLPGVRWQGPAGIDGCGRAEAGERHGS